MNCPVGLVNWTQQSSIAVSWITTLLGTAGIGEADGAVEGFLDGRWELAEAGVAPVATVRPAAAAPPRRDAPQLRRRTRTTAMARVQLGGRRSFSLIAVAGSKTSAALMAVGAPCTASYSLINSSSSAP